MRKAVYAGSFDPITNGHLWMIKEGSKLFDDLVVAIGVNPDKKYAFSLEDRVDMLRRSTRQFPNVKIDSFENEFLVNYANSIDAQYMLRGIRTEGDYEYERGMRYINSDLNPQIVTTFLMPPRELVEISSSFVKGLVGPNGWEKVIEGYVPRNVYSQFLVKFKGLQKRWNDLWQQIGSRGFSRENAYNELVSLYGKSKRSYHNFAHIANSLREFDNVRHLIENPEQVETALWYHDAVYDTRAKDNEERSAELAGRKLKEIGKEVELGEEFIENVISLILSTKHQTIPQRTDEQYLVDIDLSILGRSEKEFDEYERDIRDEYTGVSDEQFREGRSVILQKFLDRDYIYSTDFFRQKYEQQARMNLETSLTKLKSSN